MVTTTITKQRAENLSMFVFGEITNVCKYKIQGGEETTLSWIKAIGKKYNVIS
jgi:hypothetical protein